jgi:hypothetical protein
MGKEIGEGGLAQRPAALVHVMRNILGQQGEHRRPVAAVEGGVIGVDQRGGLGHRRLHPGGRH